MVKYFNTSPFHWKMVEYPLRVKYISDRFTVPQTDVVNHPTHYQSGAMEVIDVIESFNLGFHLGNVIKYILRAGKKDKTKIIEDLKKAGWYLTRYITKLEKELDAVKEK